MFTAKNYAFAIWLMGCCFVAQLPAAPSTAKNSAAKHRISFRTVQPVSGHFETDQKAAATEKTLKDLGCETKRAQHDGHVDLTYECKFWRSLILKDAAEVGKWDAWLTKNGFAVVHNTPDKNQQETVKYQLKDWKTLHFTQSQSAKAHIEMFKMLGCEVTTAKHNGHEDVKVRCAAWQELGVPSHAEAHAWMGVLKKLGFLTLHEH